MRAPCWADIRFSPGRTSTRAASARFAAPSLLRVNDRLYGGSGNERFFGGLARICSMAG